MRGARCRRICHANKPVFSSGFLSLNDRHQDTIQTVHMAANARGTEQQLRNKPTAIDSGPQDTYSGATGQAGSRGKYKVTQEQVLTWLQNSEPSRSAKFFPIANLRRVMCAMSYQQKYLIGAQTLTIAIYTKYFTYNVVTRLQSFNEHTTN